jgi:DNA-binding CsgD family transcriptional regulator
MSEPSPGSGAPRSIALTPRQRQILGLMCKGKANKEIANELDISLGTVKQHIAALFKRMRVQNRSMAVAQGQELLAEAASPDTAAAIAGADWADDIMLIRRPCIVLAVRVSPTLVADGQALMTDLIKVLSSEIKAFHLSGGDESHILLLGVRKPSAWDAIKALLLLQQLHDQALAQGLCDPGDMAAALDGGMAVISINAFGRWSGDTVATPIISIARRQLGQCPNGMLALGEPVLHLLERFHALDRQVVGPRLSLEALETLFALDTRTLSGAPWHPHQTRRLETPSRQSRLLVGPLGSGKSHLCRSLVARAREQGRATCYVRLMPAAPQVSFRDADTGKVVSVDDMVPVLVKASNPGHKLCVIDDLDLLDSATARQALMAQLQPVLTEGAQLILTARSHILEDAEPVIMEGFDRLEDLPLFALELATNADRSLTLPLLLAIASELDRHPLDWRLLRVLVQTREEPTLSRVQDLTGLPISEIEQSVQIALNAGLLHVAEPDQRVCFAKPLMRRAIAAILI